MGQHMTTETKRWLKVMAQREINNSRRDPLAGEFFVESIDENKWCDRIECLDLHVALHVEDASGYDSNARMGVVSNAWGDALKGIVR